MAGEDAFDEIVRGLTSPSWQRIRDAVDRSARLLQAKQLGDDAVAQLAAELVKLVDHGKWEVRRAVARAVSHLPVETSRLLVARLLDDEHSYVRDAARRSLARATELAHADALALQQVDVLQRRLARFEERHGSAAAKDAMRLAEKHAELFIREARHEIINVIASLELSLVNLDQQIHSGASARAKLTTQVGIARERARFLKAIIDSLQELVEDVAPKLQREDLTTLLDETIAMVRDRFSQAGHRVVVDVDVSRGLHVHAHRHRLMQAFRNILQNAFEACDAEATVEISVRARRQGEHHVVVSVVDRGCGMSDDVQREAFRLYSTSKAHGTGLGLPLAKKIVEVEHRGSIELSSAPGRGTTVIVRLPIEQDERES